MLESTNPYTWSLLVRERAGYQQRGDEALDRLTYIYPTRTPYSLGQMYSDFGRWFTLITPFTALRGLFTTACGASPPSITSDPISLMVFANVTTISTLARHFCRLVSRTLDYDIV